MLKNPKIDEFSRLEMVNNLYIILLEYFDSEKGTKEASKVENNACRYAIMFLIPYLEERIYN